MADNPGALRRLWHRLAAPSAKYSVLAIFVVGGVAGVIFWGGFNTAMEATNTLEFCISCHEMRDTVFKEYKETVHFANRSGVRAVCSDCHVPRDWGHKVLRKIQASGELYGKVIGAIDTPAKFEAKRAELARHVWKRMKETDSLECRNCHSNEAMSSARQTEKAQARHKKGAAEGMTCIDCHFAIAHNEPEGPGPRELFPSAAAK
ncbi:MAG: NapC/NirT family cytochrome c [Burkholderiaceae bacterium]|nr:NapC/NirT family cytochrome c [Burkholderiaceae bacterium]